MKGKKQFRKIRQFLCLLLSAVLIFGTVPIELAFASEGETTQGAEELREAGGEKPEAEEDSGLEPDSEVSEETETEVTESVGTKFTENTESEVYANSISGMLWLDMFDDIPNGIYAGDGVRQAEEQPLAGYTVYFYAESDTDSAVQTVQTDANGKYSFENLEPGRYTVGVKTKTMKGVEYLLPFFWLDGIEGDNRFVAAYDEETDAYLYAYTAPIEIAEDTVVTDLDGGMRTPPEAQPMAGGATRLVQGARIVVDNTFDFQIPANISWDGTSASVSNILWSTGNQSTRRIDYQLATDSSFGSIVASGTCVNSATNITTGRIDLSFSSITVGQTYYLRFVKRDTAANVIWTTTSYGDYFYFSVPPATTTAATSITQTSAILNGTYNTVGASGNVFYQYGTTTSYGSTATYSASTTVSSTTSAPVNVSLTPNTTYHYRIGVTAGGITNYGSNMTFTTLPQITAVAVGPVNSTSGYVSATFHQGLNSVNPTAVRVLYNTTNTTTGATSVLVGSGATYRPGFSNYVISGLSPNTVYYVWVQETNAGGTTTFSTVRTFTTLPVADKPVISGITTTGAYLSAQATNSGSAALTGARIEISRDGGSTWSDFSSVGYGVVGGAFQYWYTTSGLAPNTQYQYRIYATNAGGSVRSLPSDPFTTLPDFTSWNATASSALTTEGTISGIYAGDQPITGATITYGKQPNLSDGITITLAPGEYSDAGFNYTLTGLDVGTTYYVSTTVTNVTGTTDSASSNDIKSFHTGWDLAISKTVTGAYGDPNKAFEVTITLEDSGTPVTGTHSYIGSAISGVTVPVNGIITFDATGQGIISLKHGQTITIQGLPQGHTYTVEETDGLVTGGLYTATYSGTGTVSGSGDCISETLGTTTAAVSITNDRSTVPASGVGGGGYWLGAVGVLTVLAGALVMLLSSRRRRKYR